jgi:hypothetical protein
MVPKAWSDCFRPDRVGGETFPVHPKKIPRLSHNYCQRAREERLISMSTRILLVVAVLQLFFASIQAGATTVIAPTFDELVAQAQTIFQGTATKVESAWVGEGAERRIVTYVTFAVEDPIKGDAVGSYTIRMLGGTVEGRTMKVTDAPEFKVGDRDILFVENNGKQFIPLVGIMHGRYRVQKDGSDRDLVTDDSGAPVSAVSRGAKVATTNAPASSGLTTDEFKAAIRAEMNHAK